MHFVQRACSLDFDALRALVREQELRSIHVEAARLHAMESDAVARLTASLSLAGKNKHRDQRKIGPPSRSKISMAF
jgi:hypothetical protein